ncbi:hypothetical protein RRG08_000223 [Elysia crispata]|uniref:Uncharacterized protein n=1 Tax=Elysia crispata TaxID=231223 RepID=A0AAE1AWJ7_9GAST|nr:hypothetical protein RRG08_000223 [Elysia crispata]
MVAPSLRSGDPLPSKVFEEPFQPPKGAKEALIYTRLLPLVEGASLPSKTLLGETFPSPSTVKVSPGHGPTTEDNIPARQGKDPPSKARGDPFTWKINGFNAGMLESGGGKHASLREPPLRVGEIF